MSRAWGWWAGSGVQGLGGGRAPGAWKALARCAGTAAADRLCTLPATQCARLLRPDGTALGRPRAPPQASRPSPSQTPAAAPARLPLACPAASRRRPRPAPCTAEQRRAKSASKQPAMIGAQQGPAAVPARPAPLPRTCSAPARGCPPAGSPAGTRPPPCARCASPPSRRPSCRAPAGGQGRAPTHWQPGRGSLVHVPPLPP